MMSLDLEDRLRRYGDTFERAATASETVGHTVERGSKKRAGGGRRLAAATVLVGLVVAGAVAIPRLFDDDLNSGQVRLGTTPTSDTSALESLSRPVLDGCTPTFATHNTLEGSSFSSPPAPTEVYADPTRGLNGPLTAVLRFPGTGGSAVNDGSAGGKVANGEVQGREANFQVFPNTYGGAPNGGATWDLADGGSAMVYSYGLTIDDLHAFADAIDAGTPSFPAGLQSIGQVTTADVASSQCLDADGGQNGVIIEVRGSLASRYAEMLSNTGNIPLRFIDTNDSSIVIWSVRSDVNDRSYHEATPDEWSRLLQAAPHPSASDNTDPSSTTGP
jgi:hypothetical protein